MEKPELDFTDSENDSFCWDAGSDLPLTCDGIYFESVEDLTKLRDFLTDAITYKKTVDRFTPVRFLVAPVVGGNPGDWVIELYNDQGEGSVSYASLEPNQRGTGAFELATLADLISERTNGRKVMWTSITRNSARGDLLKVV